MNLILTTGNEVIFIPESVFILGVLAGIVIAVLAYSTGYWYGRNK
jgi:hypothetical protein